MGKFSLFSSPKKNEELEWEDGEIDETIDLPPPDDNSTILHSNNTYPQDQAMIEYHPADYQSDNHSYENKDSPHSYSDDDDDEGESIDEQKQRYQRFVSWFSLSRIRQALHDRSPSRSFIERNNYTDHNDDDDNDHTSTHAIATTMDDPQHHQLSKHYIHQNSSVGAPIHYHIYYTPSDTQQQQRSDDSFIRCGCCKCSERWIWVVSTMILLLSHLIYLHGPAAPPHVAASINNDHHTTPSTTNWSQYLREQSELLTTLIASWSAVLHYILLWSWRSLQEDLWKAVRRPASEPPSICQRPWDPWNPNSLQTYWKVTEWPLFGQDMALQRLQSAILQHVQSRQAGTDTYGGSSTQSDTNTPLVLVATGRSSVGKGHLAHLLAHEMQTQWNDHAQGCLQTTSEYMEPPTAPPPLLLHVDARMSQTGDDTTTTRLEDHLQEYPHGSVIWISHVTHAADLLWLTRMMESSRAWNNAIVLLTSEHGSSIIDRTIQHYGSTQVPAMELEAYLHYQWQQDDLVVPPGTTFLPFLALDQRAMRLLLAHQWSNHDNTNIEWKISNSAMEHWLDDYVEWEEWTTPHERLRFCPSGGRGAERLVQQWQALLPQDCWKPPTSSNVVLWLHSNPHPANPLHRKWQILQCPADFVDAPNDDCIQHCHFVV